MADSSGKKGMPAHDPQDYLMDDFLLCYGMSDNFSMEYREKIMLIINVLMGDSSPSVLYKMFVFLQTKGMDINKEHWARVTEAHSDFHFLPCNKTKTELISAIIVSFAGAVVHFMTLQASSAFEQRVDKISTDAALAIKQARERSLELFYRDVRKFLAGPSRSSGRDIITFDQFIEASNCEYSELAGRDKKDLRTALKKALVGGKAEIIKNNIKKYGAPSLNGKTYGCDIRLKVGDWGGSDYSKQGAVEAIKSWQALVAPSIIKGMSQFKATIELGGERREDMPSHAAASYVPSQSTVLIPQPPQPLRRNQSSAMVEMLTTRCYIYHEMTHIFGNVDPSIPLGNMGRWGDTYSLNDTSISLLADFMRSRNPEVPIDEAVKVLLSASTETTVTFGVRDSLVNPYTGALYITGGNSNLGIFETEALTSAVENFSSAETMLALFMTDRELFSHALALFYGEYFNEDV